MPNQETLIYVYKRNTLSPLISIITVIITDARVPTLARGDAEERGARHPSTERSIEDDDDDGDGVDAPRGDGRRPARVRTPTRFGFAGHGEDDEKRRERQDARERRSQDGVRVVGASVCGCVRFDCDS